MPHTGPSLRTPSTTGAAPLRPRSELEPLDWNWFAETPSLRAPLYKVVDSEGMRIVLLGKAHFRGPRCERGERAYRGLRRCGLTRVASDRSSTDEPVEVSRLQRKHRP